MKTVQQLEEELRGHVPHEIQTTVTYILNRLLNAEQELERERRLSVAAYETLGKVRAALEGF